MLKNIPCRKSQEEVSLEPWHERSESRQVMGIIDDEGFKGQCPVQNCHELYLEV